MSQEDGVRLIQAGKADALAFGGDYIANPDLADRLQQSLPFNTPDKDTYYGDGPVSYTDYPLLTTTRQKARGSGPGHPHHPVDSTRKTPSGYVVDMELINPPYPLALSP
jgi:hypothetical protein